MKKSTSVLWRMLVTVVIVISLVSAISIQAALSAPATVSAAPPPGCPKTPTTPSPANLSTVSPFTGLAWAVTTNATHWDVLWDEDYNGIPETIIADDISNPYLSFSGLISALSLDALDGCETYYWQVVAWNASKYAPGACSNTSKIFQFNTGPMIGAVTGWEWVFPQATVGGSYDDDPSPYNTNDRTSIMVVFDEWCFDDYGFDESLNANNFKVTYTYSANGRLSTAVNETPGAAIVHYWSENDYENCGSSDDYALVFLTLSKAMATNATPTVRLMNGTAQIQSVTADDGIAPIIDLSYMGSPYAGGDITVTATATEPLVDAYIVTSSDDSDYLPAINFFPAEVQEPDEYGGYGCDEDFDWFGYTDMEEMGISGSKATYTFNMEAQDPQETFFVEVYAHDNTWCDDDWMDDACKWWRHEKWSSSSQTIEGYETIVLHLVEGWNLISFPRTPADPTLRGVFGDNIVSKVYTFKAGRWYGAKYDSASGTWMSPAGVGPLTTMNIEPGVGYWVYCSNAGVDQEFFAWYLEQIASYYADTSDSDCEDLDAEIAWTDLTVRLQPVNPLVVPPAYPLTAGWNLVGVPVQGSMDAYQIRWDGGYSEIHHAPVTIVSDFLSSVKPHWKALYWYLPAFTLWCDEYDESYTFPSGYQIATPDTTQSDAWKLAYWMSAFGSGTSCFPADIPDWIVPETCSDEFAGYNYDYGYGGGLDGWYDYEYNCDVNDEFWFEWEGTTSDGNELYLDLYGDTDEYSREVYGWDDGNSYLYDDETDEYIYFDELYFDGGTMTWDEGDIVINASFSGTLYDGREVTGTFEVYWAFDYDDGCDDYYYPYSEYVEGTVICGDNFIGNFDIDDATMEDIAPVVMPGYGYWVYVDQAIPLVPTLATATGFDFYMGPR